jgi:hypothetical protein
MDRMAPKSVAEVRKAIMDGLEELEANDAIDNFDDAFFFLRQYFLARVPDEELALRFLQAEAAVIQRGALRSQGDPQ